MGKIKIVFFSDSHLGLDYPITKRNRKPTRGDDFFDNFENVINEAIEWKADFLVHGGDLFFRSKVSSNVIEKAFELLKRAARQNIIVLIVPGNHERSFIEMSLFDMHPNILFFDRPVSYRFNLYGRRIVFSGFPFYRGDVRNEFNQIKKELSKFEDANHQILCLHHAVEGAKVGVQNYTFRNSEDVIRINDIPDHFNYVFAGHIHRAQVLKYDLEGNKVAVPVIYCGSIERTALAERNEPKGFYRIEINEDGEYSFDFRQLTTRVMNLKVIECENKNSDSIIFEVDKFVNSVQDNSYNRIKLNEFTYGNHDKGFLAKLEKFSSHNKILDIDKSFFRKNNNS